MKKTYIALFLCLLMVFGAITVLWSNSDLKKAYDDAQKARRENDVKTEKNLDKEMPM